MRILPKSKPVKAFLGVIAFLLIIQCIPARIDQSPTTREVSAPPEVMASLKRACYDCHSSEINRPWYGKLAPISWYMAREINFGRAAIDFSKWDEVGWEANLLGKVYLSIERGHMPTHDYLWLKPEAQLSEEEIKAIRAWCRPYEQQE